MSMDSALRIDDIISKLFNVGLVDAVSMKEYTKWACVCKSWRKEHSIFYTTCLADAIQFKTVCLKEIAASRDLSSLMRGMKQFIWNYNVQVVSIAL